MDGNQPQGQTMTQNTASPEEIKALRVEVDAIMQKVEHLALPYGNVPYVLKRLCEENVFEHLTEAKMWLGKCLEVIGTPFPAELADKAPKAE